MNNFKDNILEALPGGLGTKLYLLKNGSKHIHSEILDNVFIDMEIRKKDELWTKRLSTKRGHEIGICEWFANHLSSTDSFFDIGSCYGIFSALVARLQPSVPIHAFEPEFVNSLFVKQNAQHNKGNVSWKICRKYVNKFSDANNTTIDDYCHQEHCYPTVMKMDIDGGEYNALIGASELIKRKKTHFLIEIHPIILETLNVDYKDILAFFDEDYIVKVLPEIRDKEMSWSDDLSLIERDQNPYIYAAPKSISKL